MTNIEKIERLLNLTNDAEYLEALEKLKSMGSEDIEAARVEYINLLIDRIESDDVIGPEIDLGTLTLDFIHDHGSDSVKGTYENGTLIIEEISSNDIFNMLAQTYAFEVLDVSQAHYLDEMADKIKETVANIGSDDLSSAIKERLDQFETKNNMIKHAAIFDSVAVIYNAIKKKLGENYDDKTDEQKDEINKAIRAYYDATDKIRNDLESSDIFDYSSILEDISNLLKDIEKTFKNGTKRKKPALDRKKKSGRTHHPIAFAKKHWKKAVAGGLVAATIFTGIYFFSKHNSKSNIPADEPGYTTTEPGTMPSENVDPTEITTPSQDPTEITTPSQNPSANTNASANTNTNTNTNTSTNTNANTNTNTSTSTTTTPTTTPTPVETTDPVVETPTPVVDAKDKEMEAIAETVYANWSQFASPYDQSTIKELAKCLNGLDSTMAIDTADSIILDMINRATVPAVNNLEAGSKYYTTSPLDLASLVSGKNGASLLKSMQLNLNGCTADPANLRIYGERALQDQVMLALGIQVEGVTYETMDPAVKLIWSRMAIGMNAMTIYLDDEVTVVVNDQTYTVDSINDSSILENYAAQARQSLGQSSKSIS